MWLIFVEMASDRLDSHYVVPPPITPKKTRAARVTRFFLWRKWTIIVILLQMYIQVTALFLFLFVCIFIHGFI